MSELEEKGREARVYYTADDLMSTTFAEPKCVVHSLITVGLNIVGGPPKVGKSTLFQGIAVAVAEGGRALGKVDVEPGDVLLAALEDSPRRLQRRLGQILDGRPAPPSLSIVTALPAMPRATDLIAGWLEDHPDARMVVVDVLAKIRPHSTAGADRYEADYRVMGELKRLADRYDVAVVAVTHTRKMGAEDVFDTVSGSTGLTGAADTTLVLRRSRNEETGSLSVTGRDIPESEYAVRFDGERSAWTLDGDALADAARRAAEARTTAGLGDRSTEIVAYVGRHPEGVTAGEVAEALGLDKAQARVYLDRLTHAERIDKPRPGFYTPCVMRVMSVTPGGAADNTHNGDNTLWGAA